MSLLRSERRSRRSRRTLLAGVCMAVPATIAAGAVAVSGTPATAAGAGQQAVSGTPITLTQPSDAMLGRVTPAADADTKGMYAPQVAWPLVPLHVALAPNGHLISYGSPLNVAQQEGMVYDDWNPSFGTTATSHQATPTMGNVNSFCNQLQLMPDGRMLMVGGNSTMSSMIFDPVSKAMTMSPNLQRQRWYPTVLHRPDDRYVVIGGADYYAYQAYLDPGNNAVVGSVPEIGTGTGAWTLLDGAASVANFGAKDNRWWYPRSFNAPDGSVFGISGDRLWSMSTTGRGSIRDVGTLPTGIGASGSTVMYAPGKILAAGGNEVANGTRTTATNAATTIDINGATPVVRAVNPMAYRRQWLNMTVLPTGDVLANGGTVVGTDGGAANSSYTAELWNPATGAWRNAATAKRIRTYHSVSVLMPSGTVVTAAGGLPGPEDNFNAEMYYPPSLFARKADGTVGWADRPQLRSIAGSLTWGGKVTLGTSDARAISSVSLITAGAVTHSQATDQRRIPLAFTQTGASLEVQLPASKNEVPPGMYLLSAVDANGVPSPSQLVTIRNGGAGLVTVYEADQSAGQVGGGGTSVEGVVPLEAGSSVSLEPTNVQGYRVRHQNFAARLDPIGTLSPQLDRLDSAFVVRRGLAAAAGVSFEASGFPGYFLRIENGLVNLRKGDGSAAFASAATFVAADALAGQGTSFQSYADRTVYLRHQDYRLKAQKLDGSDGFRLDATFRVRAALGPEPGWYRVANGNSGLRLATPAGMTVAGTPVQQLDATNRLGQEWELRDVGAGQYKIANAASGLLLGVTNISKANGAAALVWGDTGTPDHLWKIVPREGRWVFVNVGTGKVLGIDGMSKASTAASVQWDDNGTADHLWSLTQLGASIKGRAQLLNVGSGLALSTRGASVDQGAAAVQDTPSAATVQSWSLIAAGNGTFKVFNAASGLVLGITGMRVDNGGPALIWGDNGTADHLWRVVPQDGKWLLVNANSNRVLGVTGGSKAVGAAAIQWDDNGAADQRWTITPR